MGHVIAVLLFICQGVNTLMHIYIYMCVSFFFLLHLLFLFSDVILFLICLYHIHMKLDHLYHFI